MGGERGTPGFGFVFSSDPGCVSWAVFDSPALVSLPAPWGWCCVALPCGSIVAVIDGNLMHAQGLNASLLDKCPGFLIPICLVLCHPCENWGFIGVAP